MGADGIATIIAAVIAVASPGLIDPAGLVGGWDCHTGDPDVSASTLPVDMQKSIMLSPDGMYGSVSITTLTNRTEKVSVHYKEFGRWLVQGNDLFCYWTEAPRLVKVLLDDQPAPAALQENYRKKLMSMDRTKYGGTITHLDAEELRMAPEGSRAITVCKRNTGEEKPSV